MSGLELPTVTATGAAWFAWESITPGDGLTMAALVHGLETVTRGLETVIERTTPGAERETV